MRRTMRSSARCSVDIRCHISGHTPGTRCVPLRRSMRRSPIHSDLPHSEMVYGYGFELNGERMEGSGHVCLNFYAVRIYGRWR